MKKRRSSILAITLSLILAFTILGFASINFSGLHRIAYNKKVSSIKSFWLAEAGIEEAIDHLPATDTLNRSLGEGGYSTEIIPFPPDPDTGLVYRWTIESKGTVGSIERKIKVVAGPPAGKALQATGPITLKGNCKNGECIAGGYEEYASFNFDNLFKKTPEEMYDLAVNKYVNPGPNDFIAEDITWVTLTDNNVFQITNEHWKGDGILIVDGDAKISGGIFTGVLYILGTLQVGAGNPEIYGSVFVECGLTVDTKLTGNPTIEYDARAVSEAFGGTPEQGRYEVLTWQEVF
ncbi:MAG: hypothetical protein JW734_02760 [Candidatus Omnitrophica bacterium]|nr:hypothetical protein [Candidatus Omnitrophota bacterium]